MLHHRRFGKGPPLVLQHGFFGGGGYFVPQMGAFGARFDVLATDMPGFAGSAAEPVPEDMAGFAAALVGLMDALGIRRFSLVGHSMGGMVAQQVALDFPDRLDRLVLYGTAPTGNLPERFETFEQSIARIKVEGVEAARHRVASTWFVLGDRDPLFPLVEAAGRGVTLEAAIRAWQAIPRWDVRGRLGEIRVPTLVICGDRDRSTAPNHSVALWQGIPGAELCIAPNCGHNVHLEKTDFYNRVVGDFLAAQR